MVLSRLGSKRPCPLPQSPPLPNLHPLIPGKRKKKKFGEVEGDEGGDRRRLEFREYGGNCIQVDGLALVVLHGCGMCEYGFENEDWEGWCW